MVLRGTKSRSFELVSSWYMDLYHNEVSMANEGRRQCSIVVDDRARLCDVCGTRLAHLPTAKSDRYLHGEVMLAPALACHAAGPESSLVPVGESYS